MSAGDSDLARSYRGRVGQFRTWLTRHRAGAMWLVLAALLMKVAVPAGYMPMITGGSITIALCSGYGVEKTAMAMPGMSGHQGKKADHSGKDDMPCGFAGHAPAAMAGVDAILLLVAIAFIFAIVFRMPALWPVRRTLYLRPPLRGPPAIA